MEYKAPRPNPTPTHPEKKCARCIWWKLSKVKEKEQPREKRDLLHIGVGVYNCSLMCC